MFKTYTGKFTVKKMQNMWTISEMYKKKKKKKWESMHNNDECVWMC